MTGLGLAVACGMLVGLGAFVAVAGGARRTIRLGDALAALDGRPAEVTTSSEPGTEGLESVGAYLQRRLRLPLSERQQQLLRLQGRSVGDFFAEKLVFTVAGLLLPALWLAAQYLLGGRPGALPLAYGLVGAVIGYFLADWRLVRDSGRVRRSTTESIHTFFDLVALERLANASSSQAVASAAAISTAPLFRRITAGVERSRMEQTPPWEELIRISKEWNLPELGDFADVMKLEDQGAALAEVLQARVKELRDAHLSRQRAEAQEATEGLSIWMTLPALLLGVAFVTPALLKLMG